MRLKRSGLLQVGRDSSSTETSNLHVCTYDIVRTSYYLYAETMYVRMYGLVKFTVLHLYEVEYCYVILGEFFVAFVDSSAKILLGVRSKWITK